VFIKEICVTWERKGSNTERGGLKKGQELSKSVCVYMGEGFTSLRQQQVASANGLRQEVTGAKSNCKSIMLSS